jgi:catechol 2,3-dioxygenase-like lactoylglutathione lyase family enzyme
MLNFARMIGFVPTTDSTRARDFYQNKLGFQSVSDDQFALVMRAGDNMVRIAKVEKFTPAPYTVLGWEVSRIEDEVRALAARGVVFEKYPFVQDQATGIWTTPNGDKVAWFKDPDGNVLSLSEHINA